MGRYHAHEEINHLLPVVAVTLTFWGSVQQVEFEQCLTSHQTHYRSYRGQLWGIMVMDAVSVVCDSQSGEGSIPRAWHLSWYVATHPGQLSLAIPSWVSAISTSQMAVTPCGWE